METHTHTRKKTKTESPAAVRGSKQGWKVCAALCFGWHDALLVDHSQAAPPSPIHTWAPSAIASAVHPWAGTNSRAAVRMRCCSCSSLSWSSSSSPPWSVYLRSKSKGDVGAEPSAPHLTASRLACQMNLTRTRGSVPSLGTF